MGYSYVRVCMSISTLIGWLFAFILSKISYSYLYICDASKLIESCFCSIGGFFSLLLSRCPKLPFVIVFFVIISLNATYLQFNLTSQLPGIRVRIIRSAGGREVRERSKKSSSTLTPASSTLTPANSTLTPASSQP